MLVTPLVAQPASTSPEPKFQEDKMASQTLVEQFRQDIGNVSSTVDERQLRQKSHDFHWYSPVLTPQLQNCLADVVVQPRSEEEIAAVVVAAVKHRIPLTVRGGGTGNYGQSVPLQGGVVVDMTGFNKVTAVEAGHIRVQAGAVIGAALEAALKSGQQLMMYPSTMRSATIGGHMVGGFAGIGSVRHGIIRDSGMIQSVRILTIKAAPRMLTLSGNDVGFVFHSWGTTGIIVEAELKLVPAETWIDCIATFPSY